MVFKMNFNLNFDFHMFLNKISNNIIQSFKLSRFLLIFSEIYGEKFSLTSHVLDISKRKMGGSKNSLVESCSKVNMLKDSE